MKRSWIANLLVLCALFGNEAMAQSFGRKAVLDKDNRELTNTSVRASITMNDSSIIFKEDWSDEEEYLIVDDPQNLKIGSERQVAQLADGIYGHEESIYAISRSKKQEFWEDFFKASKLQGEAQTNYLAEIYKKHLYTITHRVVLNKKKTKIDNEFWWIMEPRKEGRTIYSKY